MKKPIVCAIVIISVLFGTLRSPKQAFAMGDCTISNFRGSPASPVAAGTSVRFTADTSCPSEVASVSYVVRSSVISEGIWDTNGFTFGPGTYTVTVRVVSKDDPNGMLPTSETLTYVVNGNAVARTSNTVSAQRSSRVPSAPIMGSKLQTAAASVQAIIPGINVRIRNGASLQSTQIGVLPSGWYISFADVISNGWYQIRINESTLGWITSEYGLTRLSK